MPTELGQGESPPRRPGARGHSSVLIDDPKGRRDIPRAAEAEGYAIVHIDEVIGGWSIAIEK